MLVLSLMRWWYGSGWVWAAGRLRARLGRVGRDYSVPILLKTLFSPWKQLITTAGQTSTISIKFNILIDNLVSRLVGCMVRSMTLLAAGFIWLLTLIIGVGVLILWPIIPAMLVFIPLIAFGVLL